MRPEAVEYVLDNFESAVLKALDDLAGELAQMRAREDQLEREVANLAQPGAQGDFSPALRAALVTCERAISDITASSSNRDPILCVLSCATFAALSCKTCGTSARSSILIQPERGPCWQAHRADHAHANRRALRGFRDVEFARAWQYR
jgi:hypothetical protein